ncbi:hypothetical protein STENM223S_04946 [Streptomyces tendae]
MTVPEENRPKTHDTDETLEQRREGDAQTQGGTGRTMREALEEAEDQARRLRGAVGRAARITPRARGPAGPRPRGLVRTPCPPRPRPVPTRPSFGR